MAICSENLLICRFCSHTYISGVCLQKFEMMPNNGFSLAEIAGVRNEKKVLLLKIQLELERDEYELLFIIL